MRWVLCFMENNNKQYEFTTVNRIVLAIILLSVLGVIFSKNDSSNNGIMNNSQLNEADNVLNNQPQATPIPTRDVPVYYYNIIGVSLIAQNGQKLELAFATQIKSLEDCQRINNLKTNALKSSWEIVEGSCDGSKGVNELFEKAFNDLPIGKAYL